MEAIVNSNIKSTSEVVIKNTECALLESIASWSNWYEADDFYSNDDND